MPTALVKIVFGAFHGGGLNTGSWPNRNSFERLIETFFAHNAWQIPLYAGQEPAKGGSKDVSEKAKRHLGSSPNTPDTEGVSMK